MKKDRVHRRNNAGKGRFDRRTTSSRWVEDHASSSKRSPDKRHALPMKVMHQNTSFHEFTKLEHPVDHGIDDPARSGKRESGLVWMLILLPQDDSAILVTNN